MKLTVLGYYGGYPQNGVGTSSYLVQSNQFNLLIDCGSGALLSLEKVLDPLQLNAVVLSHYHHDHTADIGVLQYYWQLHPQNRAQDLLPIYGHTQDPLNFGALNWPNSTIGKPYSEDKELVLGPFEISFLETQHPVPAFAMRITERETGKVLVFTADTNYFNKMVEFSKNSDLLLTDTNFFDDKQGKKWHLTAGESGTLAKLAGAKNLLLTHLPQNGDLEELTRQAQQSAGDLIPVQHAELRKGYQI
ncbi:hypothetical protein C5L31_001216 [Secundilactobacillus malefermentans]|uniref:Metallo-beta-lactamase domain-containing protein n=1 Tax=Secundilactobacillus malefermentans TaxID=176292 RepID=A0A4R5NTF9_9LACO|nr:MBL fold metallo-hydrolase [Secundilactobacillus malefermentans]KRM58510.1 beta-lactamase domain-containing protein [Secundilactobacillus malefermentans DSM 5705 = KCTC 3548]TDG80640.1 hypothetical protein C5L31_001216 [Secundilactobacillus malefermentans]